MKPTAASAVQCRVEEVVAQQDPADEPIQCPDENAPCLLLGGEVQGDGGLSSRRGDGNEIPRSHAPFDQFSQNPARRLAVGAGDVNIVQQNQEGACLVGKAFEATSGESRARSSSSASLRIGIAMR